ncbi:MAG: CPBP family intramembrane metalloprotease [Actinomycetaceae bacterium]|nr:CPBP family intramembrane metalloprotease [Actinomycetaceae bacterium]
MKKPWRTDIWDILRIGAVFVTAYAVRIALNRLGAGFTGITGYPMALRQLPNVCSEILLPQIGVLAFTVTLIMRFGYASTIWVEPSLQAARASAARPPNDPIELDEHVNSRAFAELSLSPDPIPVPPRRSIPPFTRWLTTAFLLVASVVIIHTTTSFTQHASSYLLTAALGISAIAFSTELLFRGLLLAMIRDITHHEWLAALIVTILYTLWAGGLGLLGATFTDTAVHTLFAFFSGLGLYALRVTTGHLWPAIALHAVWEFCFVM